MCQALQHAHQKGIVHRDVKPTNVLVAEFDNQAVPKIIDFGVAKAINQQLTERTLFTQFGQVLGTPEYMSPEQAKLNQLDVDTRSDIYSLGVLLYELLTGTTPFDKQRLRSAAFEELLRIIREEDPPRPSARLSTVDELPTVATKRKSEPRKLGVLLGGELDWLVMKAMNKERSRRYDSASALADDVQRYLSGAPVQACPPSRSYLLRKSLQQHKAAVGTAAMVLLALSLGVVATSFMAVRERQARNDAIAAQETAEKDRATAVAALAKAEKALKNWRQELTEKALMYAMAGDIVTTNKIADKLEQVEDSKAQVLMIRGLADFYGGEMERARVRLQEAVSMEPKNLSALAMLSILEGYQGDFIAADLHSSQAIDMPPREEYRDYDEFFLAYLYMYYQPSEAVTRLKELAKRKPDPLVHAQLAAALAESASYKLDPFNAADGKDEIIEAAHFIEIAKERAPDNYFIDFIDLYVQSVTIGLAKANQQSDWMNGKPNADKLAKQVELKRSSAIGLTLVAWYYRIVDEDANADRIMELLTQSTESSLLTDLRAFADDKYHAETPVLADADQPPMDRIARALLASYNSDQREHVAKVWEEDLFDELRKTRHVAFALSIPLLLGDESKCQSLAKEVLNEGSSEHFKRGIQTVFIEPMLRHLIGDLDDEQLLAEAKDTNNVSRAHLQIALKNLADGKREDAIKHFDKSASEVAPWILEAFLAKAFRDRLLHDDKLLNNSEKGGSVSE